MDKIINTPLVSVVMPAYNAALYIEQAIDSVISQSFSNWELIIINDGSIDTTADIIANYIKRDSRIKCVNQENKGPSHARNLGIANAKGAYIAFLDSDDIATPNRLEIQVDFMESNKDVILCGSWYKIMNSDKVIQLPEKDEDIKLRLLLGNCFANSSVIIRKNVLEELPLIFDFSKVAEDYDLWTRLILKGKMHNLKHVLLYYRIHKNQISTRRSYEQQQSVFETKRNLFKLLELDLLQEEDFVLEKILKDGKGIVLNDIVVFKSLQQKLLYSNSKKIFDPLGFNKLVLDLEKMVVKRCFITLNEFYPETYFNYLKVKNKLRFKLSIKEEFKLLIKSLIFFKHKH